MEITNKKLEAFLKKEGVLEQYLKNYHEQNQFDDGSINNMKTAFVWWPTQEGHDFWCDLHYGFESLPNLPQASPPHTYTEEN